VSKLTVKTPEGVLFSFHLASPVTRMFAWLVDFFVILLAWYLTALVMTIFAVISQDMAYALEALIFFAFSIGYGIFTEWYWRGQTIGKRILRLRVIDAQGLRLRFNQIVIRNLLRAVDLLPGFYGFGGVFSLFSSRAQRLGDLAANTVVIRSPKIVEPDLDQLTQGKFNSLRQYPHLEARLRQRISPVEASILFDALLRRDEFEAAERVTLFADLAEHCRALVHFPPEAAESLADEQYVRNVVDILFRKQQA
jgi:uncharacterized RDD family membrane protein YckC